MNKYFKPVSFKKELHPLSKTLAKARLEGFSFLDGLNEFVKPFSPPGVKSYYGEQMFSFIANGRYKSNDSKKGVPIYVPLANQGFDVKFTDFAGTHRIEVKTIYGGSIIGLSTQQLVVADYLAIYNPRSSYQSIDFRHKNYSVPPNSYCIIKL